jgi:hypothetical protein
VDTSKPAGAVAVIFPVKPIPANVNWRILGLADAVPTQAEMLPVTAPARIVGNDGFTVIVKVTGAPLQPVVPVTKLPDVLLGSPAVSGMTAITVFVAASMTETIFGKNCVKYTLVPSGLTDSPPGDDPALIFVMIPLVAVLITETTLECEIYNRLPSGLNAMPFGLPARAIVAVTVFVAVLITETALGEDCVV